MMRRGTLIWSVLGVAVVVGLFAVKSRVQSLEESLQHLNARIIADREAIQVQEAEWSFLNRPARLETLGRGMLGLEPVAAGQRVTIEEFANRNATTENGTLHLADSADAPPANARPKVKPAPPPEPEDWLKPILAKLKRAQ